MWMGGGGGGECVGEYGSVQAKGPVTDECGSACVWGVWECAGKVSSVQGMGVCGECGRIRKSKHVDEYERV